jgi:tetratricopeptide (TPR) repeat protein
LSIYHADVTISERVCEALFAEVCDIKILRSRILMTSTFSTMHGDAPELPLRDAVWNALVAAFLRHDRETPALLARLIVEFPDEPMGPLTKGYMLLMLSRAELRAAAEEAYAEGMRRLALLPDVRAAFYAQGLRAWLDGNPRGAVRAMERIIDNNPLDAMAVKVSHAVRFMLGDADGMRRSLARIVSIYTDAIPNAGYIRGCYAFALEETGDYIEAEKVGRRAVQLEPRDAWGRHAVAHVFEMTGRASEGLNWLSDKSQWEHCNNFSFHMAWHIALFQLELGRNHEALALYDSAIRAEKTDDFRDIANAASLLQRLEIAGLSVGNRWEELADLAERRIRDRQLVFADLHYMLALLGAGRFGTAETMVRSMLDETPVGHNGRLSAEIGVPVAAGLVAFAAGRMEEAVQLLEPLRDKIQPIGGSHAQRDVFQQVYLEALVRSGAPQAKAALESRLASRSGTNLFASERLARILNRSALGKVALQTLGLTPTLQVH